MYAEEIDRRFVPVVAALLARAGLQPGERVLDLGTGTGAVAIEAATLVGPSGRVVGIDISPRMRTVAQQHVTQRGLRNAAIRDGRAEAIPSADGAFDVVLASLSLMYALDRAAAARECARVLRTGGRFVAAVWAGPEECDIVRFQQAAGRFAPEPSVTGVGPGALADPAGFLAQLAAAGIRAQVEPETMGFDVPNVATSWAILARVTAAQLPSDRRRAAQEAVRALMWPDGDGPRHFRNVTQYRSISWASASTPSWRGSRGALGDRLAKAPAVQVAASPELWLTNAGPTPDAAPNGA